MPKRVLVLTYEFPPAAGAGVQRAAKFARYLPASGWTPVVVTSEPVWGRPVDGSLLESLRDVEVMRIPGRHVGARVARTIAPIKKVRRPGTSDKPTAAAVPAPVSSARPADKTPLSTKVSRWLAVPDDAAYWIPAALDAALEAASRRPVEAVFATGPPHSVLVAGARVSRTLGIPLVADMRDAWRDNPGLRSPTAWHRARSLEMERLALGQADIVLAVSEPIAAEAREMGGRDVRVLPNGFDPTDLPHWRPDPDGPLQIVYMGRFYGSHDPKYLLEGMAQAIGSGGVAEAISLVHVGPESSQVVSDLRRLGIADHYSYLGYKPHREALEITSRADVGLVVISEEPGARANYTGKLFEYLGMGQPVLVVGPTDGAAASLVREASAGRVAPDGDVEAIADTLAGLARDKAERVALSTPIREVIGRFDRRDQAALLGTMLNELTGGGDV